MPPRKKQNRLLGHLSPPPRPLRLVHDFREKNGLIRKLKIAAILSVEYENSIYFSKVRRKKDHLAGRDVQIEKARRMTRGEAKEGEGRESASA